MTADLDLVGAGVKIHALGGRLGLKKHCRAGWRGHVPLLDGILGAINISFLIMAAELDQGVGLLGWRSMA